MATTAERDKVRLYVGDTNADRPLFNDNEIDLVIDDRAGNALLAAADLCDILATRFARDHDVEWQGGTNARTKLSRSQMSKAYADRATALRKRAAGQVSTFSTARVDGFSDDLDSREGPASRRRDGSEVPIEFLDQEALT
jgi:hypothetical protein